MLTATWMLQSDPWMKMARGWKTMLKNKFPQIPTGKKMARISSMICCISMAMVLKKSMFICLGQKTTRRKEGVTRRGLLPLSGPWKLDRFTNDLTLAATVARIPPKLFVYQQGTGRIRNCGNESERRGKRPECVISVILLTWTLDGGAGKWCVKGSCQTFCRIRLSLSL